MQIICESPNIILNPLLGELLCKYHTYFIQGARFIYPFKYRALIDKTFKKHFYEFKDRVNLNNLSDFVVVDESTGCTYNIFIAVPCGHCELCKEKKVNSFVSRCRLESQSYDSQPWFFTLTYDDNHVPKDGVSVREIQLFMKRLRVNLYRYGYRDKIRFVACGEYGKRTHRSHYHLIIWNLHPTKYSDFKELLAIFDKSWNKGFIQSRIIDPSNDRSFFYTTKYMYKDCVVPEGCNPCFITYSRGHGSIGSAKIDELSKSIQKSLNVNFHYYDKWTGKPTPLVFTSYVLNRVFPSLSRSVTSKVRTAVKEFSYFFEEFKQREPSLTWLFESIYEKLYLFKDSIYFGSAKGREHPICFLSDAQIYGKLSCYASTLLNALQKVEKFKTFVELDRLRQVFMGRLLLSPCVADIATKSYTARNRRLRRASTEIL